MPVKKITDLTDIGTPESADLLEIVDVSDTTDSPEGTSKKVLVSALGGGTTLNLQVYETGETPIENVDEIEFNGATVVNDGGGKVTVTVTGGGGGIPDAPNDTFGYIRKDLGWVKSTLAEALNGGKTATFTGVGGEDISINMGGDDGGGEAADFVIMSKTVGDEYFETQNRQKLKTSKIQSYKENTVTGEIKSSNVQTDEGEFSVEKQNGYGSLTANQLFEFEDIAEGDIPIDNIVAIFKPKPKFVSGTYYLVDEDYVNNAIAGVTTPDATPTVKGIAKLYTSLGSNTDGAVDQNTVNTALDLKANAPLIDTVSSSPLTGVATEGILKSYLIPANTYSSSDILNFANDLYKTGTAGTLTSRLYTNTSASLSGASLLATNISTPGNRKVTLRRQLVLKDGNIEVISATSSTPDDNVNSSSPATLVTFNPAVDNYFITTAQNASTGDSTIQNNLKLHY